MQSIHDTTASRSAVAAALAKAIAAENVNDPLIMQAATEVLLPTAIRKAQNRLLIAKKAAENLEQAAADANESQAEQLDEDWLNTFARFAEDASTERLQNMFGRILAGECYRRNSYSLATLRAVSELDQATADDLCYAWARSVGGAVDYSPEWQRGDDYLRWKRLVEAGIMAATASSQYPPSFIAQRGDHNLWTPMSVGSVWITVLFEQGATTHWEHIGFTKIGQQIGSLLEKPNYEDNIRRAAKRLPRHGILKIHMQFGNQIQEIWRAEASEH